MGMTMTDAKVLADALVEAGILIADGSNDTRLPMYRLVGDMYWKSAPAIIVDWCVAGKVLERSHMAFIEQINGWQVRYDKAYGCRTREWHHRESLPLAIIEAWYAATEQGDPDHEPENSMCACPTCINEEDKPDED
jgi:hypothetical protein